MLSQAGEVSLAIFNAAGGRVRTLLHAASLTAGAHPASWDGRNDQGRPLPAGAYAYQLISAAGVGSRTVSLLR